MMEQGNGDNDNDNANAVLWSQDEREVSEFLLQMRRVILDSDSDLKVPFQWGRKRKRSAIKVSTSRSSISRDVLRNSNGTGSDGAAGDSAGGGVVAAEKKIKKNKNKKKAKVEASSPATPLSLSLTESDEKNTNNNNNNDNEKPLRTKASLKKKKDYYVKTNRDLTERNVELNQAVDKVSRYSEELKAYLLMLKQRKIELRNGSKMEPKNPISQIGCQMQQQHNSMAQNQNQHQINNNHHHQQQQFFQVPNTPQQLRINQNSGALQSNPYSESLTMVNNPSSTSTSGFVLDLNVLPEEFVHVEPYQPLDVNMNRVMAAQARQRRIQINRLKNNTIGNNNNSKLRYSCRA